MVKFVMSNEKETVELAIKCLEKGELIILPTDTVYGIGGMDGSWEIIANIYKAKNRPLDKPIPLLVYNLHHALYYGAYFTESALMLIEKFWPGPLTVVTGVLTEKGIVYEGFRSPDCDVVLEIIRQLNKPLRVTSANISGQKPALTVEEAISYCGKYVSLAIDGGKLLLRIPSTVIKLWKDEEDRENIEIIREGAISIKEILDNCKKDIILVQKGVNNGRKY